MNFLKESLVSAEEQVRALQTEIGQVTGLRAKVQALEAQLLSTEVDKERIVRDMTQHGEEVHRFTFYCLLFDLVRNLLFINDGMQ